MNKTWLVGAPLMLWLVHVAAGSPVRPFADNDKGFRQVLIEPFSTRTFNNIRCQANERTALIVYGQGTSPMAAYVFDAHGNCVAWDDLSISMVPDDLALEWYPPAEQAYDVEVRNLGRKSNQSEIVIR
ncbi:MAG: hypothetical protein L0Y71_17440 [Gemmataceae bacterium]|nr:hypothetical protein [Gemmataceae bacterium]